MTITPMIIAVDGPAASGKGTVAAAIARHYDFAYLDTGLLYRAIGWLAARDQVALADAAAVGKWLEALDLSGLPLLLAKPELRAHATSTLASQVAALPAVRQKLLKYQQDFCEVPPHGKVGAVLDGRDIGTVIAPEAPLKLFVTASAAARAERRWRQLLGQGQKIELSEVAADIASRDARDQSRSTAPLLMAKDAHLLDTTALDVAGSIATALALCATHWPRHWPPASK